MKHVSSVEKFEYPQPVVAYEGGVFVNATYRAETVHNNPDDRYIIGFDKIDQLVERLFEVWEDNKNLVAGIDACTIAERFAGHFPTLPDTMYDTLLDEIVTSIEKGAESSEVIIRASQLPVLETALEKRAIDKILASENLDNILFDRFVYIYLEAYAENNIPQGGKIDALFALLSSCKIGDSTL